MAAEAWNKTPEQWSLADVYDILSDSPWTPSKSQVDFGLTWTRRNFDPATRLPSTDRTAPHEDVRAARIQAPGRSPLPEVTVLWWSSRTVRLAQQRLRQLRDKVAPAAPAAELLDDFVIRVEGSEPLRIFQDAEQDLRDTVYLELPGTSLDVKGFRLVAGQRAGEDYVDFHFPRQIEGRATISPDAARVVFHCKATAKNAPAGRANALSLSVAFEPRKMRVRGQPDL